MQGVSAEVDQVFGGTYVEAKQPWRDEWDRITCLKTRRWLARFRRRRLVQGGLHVGHRKRAIEPGQGAGLGVEDRPDPRCGSDRFEACLVRLEDQVVAHLGEEACQRELELLVLADARA